MERLLLLSSLTRHTNNCNSSKGVENITGSSARRIFIILTLISTFSFLPYRVLWNIIYDYKLNSAGDCTHLCLSSRWLDISSNFRSLMSSVPI